MVQAISANLIQEKTLLEFILMQHTLFLTVQFFYAIASSKFANVIVLCLAQIMVTCV